MISRKGLAIVTTLAVVIICSMLAGMLLVIVSSQARIMEQHVRRTKGDYVSESGIVAAFDALQRNVSIPASAPVTWTYSISTGNPTSTKNATVNTIAGTGNFSNTTQINSTFNYSSSQGW